MSKKNFIASNWLGPEKVARETFQNALKTNLNTLNNLSNGSDSSTPKSNVNNFFIPGWKGESLISKDVKLFNSILDKFHTDAKIQLNKNLELPRKLKILIYNEFLSYTEFRALNFSNLDHYTHFWSELQNKNSTYRKEIDRFIDVLSFRIAVIYLLKVRFIITLQEKTKLKFDIKSIYYPNSYLAKIFKTASSMELKTKAFEQNVYSWYRPNEKLKTELLKFKDIATRLNITEIIKNISLKSEKILDSKTDYSHSISHKNFGLFLNSLLINFPCWLNSINNNKYSYNSGHRELEIISTKFSGDNLESLALSHWLAQHENKDLKWDQVLCPDFKKHDFKNGSYLKIINEIQFLTFLTQIAEIQGKEPQSFLSEVINTHLSNRKESSALQKNLTLDSSGLNYSTYDRIILNLNIFPKNNPQHYLFNQISTQKQFMKENGLLYVITSKKLFVPSQKSKVESLLQGLKIEGRIDLENISGKGEIGSYIYIFSNNLFKKVSKNNKHTCLSFRFHGNLETFQDFSKITDLNIDFFNKYSDLPPLHQKSLGNFRFEFFQDAIVGGQLIYSSSKDSTKVTHPKFFKNLMNICNPLDYFFEIDTVDFNSLQKDESEDTLFNFSNSFKREQSEYTLIVDQRASECVLVEIIPTSTLEAKAYEYGHSLCSYFYIYSKWTNLEIQTVKDYLNSNVGRQVVNLTFCNESRKIKGNLTKVLIPKYLTNCHDMPEHIKSGLDLLSYTADQILSMHPTEIERNYSNIKKILPNLVQSYPGCTLSLLSSFKRSVETAFERTGCLNKSTAINFNNPILKTPLLFSKTYAIYPDNKDIHIDFNPEAHELIHHRLSNVRKVSEENSDHTNHGLKLYVEKGEDEIVDVITIYSDEHMINFLDFLLSNVSNTPIAKILQGVKTPELEDLKSILSSYNSLTRFLTEFNSLLPNEFNTLLNSTILAKNT